MNRTTTREANCLHVAGCKNVPQSQLSVIGVFVERLLSKKAHVFGMSFLLAMFFQLIPLYKAAAQNASQNITVKGKVVDSEDNSPIPGISLTNAITKKVLGQTNDQGVFSITVNKGITVNFSMIGYSTNATTFTAATNNIVIRMKSSASNLNEVVVTALGIKREEKSLGYAVTKLDSNQFTDAVSSNWTDALSGKVAGLNLVRNSGPAGSNKIILRGENNLTGDNEALIVIDGVVASSSSRRTAATGGGVYGTDGDVMPPDFGSGLNDLNPEDIESVTVLKGPAASALYGQRGANGAIIITTKSANKGSNNKTLSISFTQNSTWEQVNRNVDRQNQFGQGQYGVSYFSYGATVDGASTNGTSATWGAPFVAGGEFYQYDPATQVRGLTRTPWVAYEDPITAFFKTGYTSAQALTLSGTYKKVGMRLSVSHNENDWIVPNTGLDRTTVAFNANANLTKKLSINIKAQYSNRHSDNLPATGYGNQALMYWFMFAQPNVNVDWYRDYWVHGKEGTNLVNITTTNPESPYAISELYLNGQRRNGFLGNIQANYKFNKALSLMVRASGDFNKDQRETKRPWDAAGGKYVYGLYRLNNVRSYEINADFMLKYEKKINKNIHLNATLGGSQLRNEYGRLETRADGLVEPGIYTLDNHRYSLIYVPDTSRYRINSFYGTVSLSYKNYLYLDLTGRQDWNSTLATTFRAGNEGFFYPSASLAFVASDYWKLPKAVSFAKLRASVAQVGSGSTIPYRTGYFYRPVSYGVYADTVLTNPNTVPNPDLKPLITTTVELGLDLKLFKNRLNFDLAVYAGNTKNQILNRIVDRASGYYNAIVNVGRVDNKGIELSVNATPYQTKKFKWTLNGTFTANRNKIKELADSSIVLRTGNLGSGQVVAVVGGSMGDLYGVGFMRSPGGQIVFDAKTGYAKPSADIMYLGNTLPKFKFSFGTGVSYKQFSANVLFDAQVGAVAHSLTFSRMAALGKLNITLPGRYNGVIGDGVVWDATSNSYRKNDVIATDFENYYYSLYGSDQAEGSIFSTDFVKFREANLTYTFGKKFLKRTEVFNKITIGVYGRNLLIWSPWPGFDPEFGTISGTDIVQGFEVGQLPSTRSFGFRVVVGL